MVRKNIPVELLCLIFEFAYGYKFSSNPIHDVDVQKNIQACIPACFFMSTLPPVGWFTCTTRDYTSQFLFHRLRQVECVLIPSPFKRGNPYYPTHGLDPLFPKWSPSVAAFVKLLSSTACQHNHTYKRCIVRKALQMMQDSVLSWNVYYKSLFHRDILLEKKHFFLKAYPWSEPFISMVISQLHTAQFLPFCSHELV